MTNDEFKKITEQRIKDCKSVLIHKGEIYTENEDRLSNFRSASLFENKPMKEVIWGMMLKHNTKLKDMCNSENLYKQEQWDETIGDMINYLLLLNAAIKEKS